MDKYEILKKYFGYETFRGAQEQLIDSILAGRDTLGIMPTGAGKSLCYQIPALLFEGITLVVSPLISLMKDQVGSLNAAGIHAAYLNSSLTPGQYRKALEFARQGRYPIIYVAPERLMTPEFLDFAGSVKIAMVAVDRELRRRNMESRIVLQVHDELLVEARESEAEEVVRILEDKMKHAADLKVSLEVEAKTGRSWFDAK